MSNPKTQRAELLKAVQQAGSRYGARFLLFHQAVADRLGLNVIDLRCLRLARDSDGVTAGQLAKITGLTTGTITGVIDRLENAGFVRRERDGEDRRRVTIKLLQSGQRKLDKIMEPLSSAMNQAMAGLSDDQLAAVLDFFTKTGGVVAEQIEQLRIQSTPK
jgi:DNA-binding MarR family transcriptional regulator